MHPREFSISHIGAAMQQFDSVNGTGPADDWLDCIVIGGGPAGCTATLHLLRSARRVLMIDAGRSRTRYIASTHNCPGFPSGISGPGLVDRLRSQLRSHAAPVSTASVARVESIEGGYAVHCPPVVHRSRCVIVATGVVDRLPAWPGVDAAIQSGVIRLCPICDAYEQRGKRIAVYGEARDCVSHACFLRTFSLEVTALHRRGDACSTEDLALARSLGIVVAEADEGDCRVDGDGFHAALGMSGDHRFDTVYVALGADAQSSLLAGLEVRRAEQGDIVVDAHCETSCPGLFAIGDVVSALNQIAVAFGHAAIAASAVHRRLPRNPMGADVVSSNDRIAR
jgi:thioredoxin reductase (NADPH)